MNLPAVATDNITELLIKIVEFTQTRQKVLIQNINNINSPGFVPKDLAVEEFSGLVIEAIEEHARSQRLLLRDSANVKFGASGSFHARPIIDRYAKEVLEKNRDEYLRLQTDKLLENSLNQRIAVALLKEKEGEDVGFRPNPN
jgi:flagellar basal body rod protein FlgB